MTHRTRAIHGRGTRDNPANRFDAIEYVPDPDFTDPDPSSPRTQYLRDTSRSVIAKNDSPDVGFDASINPYRGCEHGCVYCYARPGHEYLGFSAGLDFETKILVKENAPQLLRAELSSRAWRPKPLGVSGVTDPYQPIERRLGLTRGCLEVLVEFRNPVIVITKNHLVTRDVDLLADLASHDAACVCVSVTTLDANLASVMEPRTSRPSRRLAAIETLSEAGIPVAVLVAPIIPALTDHEVPAIIRSAADAGARFGAYTVVRLPYGVKDLFDRWLSDHFPDRKDKVMNRIRAIRNGRLNDTRFGRRNRGEGAFAEQISAMFRLATRRAGLEVSGPTLSTAAFRRSSTKQMSLFG